MFSEYHSLIQYLKEKKVYMEVSATRNTIFRNACKLYKSNQKMDNARY